MSGTRLHDSVSRPECRPRWHEPAGHCCIGDARMVLWGCRGLSPPRHLRVRGRSGVDRPRNRERAPHRSCPDRSMQQCLLGWRTPAEVYADLVATAA